MTDPPVYNLDDSDEASTMTTVSDSSEDNIDPFAATFDDPLVELNEILTDALDRRQKMLENLSRIKKDLLEINRNDKENATQRANTMREFREGCDKAAELIADMKSWVKRQAEWRREEQDKRWLEEIVMFERAMMVQKKIMEQIIEEAEEKENRAG